MTSSTNPYSTWIRLGLCTLIGIAAGLISGSLGLRGPRAATAWIVGVSAFCLWSWIVVWRMDADQTRSHSTAEDAAGAGRHVLVVVAALGSLVGLAVLLVGSSKQKSSDLDALMGVLMVVGSWVLVHTLYTFRYARLFYANPDRRPIDFNTDDWPDYHDFAYLAFTLGMTYQVSDTNLQSKQLRRTALAHCLLSYLMGAIVIAATVNLVSQLASS